MEFEEIVPKQGRLRPPGMTIIARLLRRIPGFRLLWCPLALSMALLAFVLAGMLRLRFLGFDGSRPLAAAIGCVGVLLAVSALPGLSDQAAE